MKVVLSICKIKKRVWSSQKARTIAPIYDDILYSGYVDVSCRILIFGMLPESGDLNKISISQILCIHHVWIQYVFISGVCIDDALCVAEVAIETALEDNMLVKILSVDMR